MKYSIFAYTICTNLKYHNAYYDVSHNLGSFEKYEDMIGAIKQFFDKHVNNKYNEYIINYKPKSEDDKGPMSFDNFKDKFNTIFYTPQINSPVNLISELITRDKTHHSFDLIKVFVFNSNC